MLSFLYGNALESDPGSQVCYLGGPTLSTSVVWFQVSCPVPLEPLCVWKVTSLPSLPSLPVPSSSALVFSAAQPSCVSCFMNTPQPDPAHHLILLTIRWGLWLFSLRLYPSSVWSLPLSACFSSELFWHSAWQVGENACDKWLCAFQDSFWSSRNGGW